MSKVDRRRDRRLFLAIVPIWFCTRVQLAAASCGGGCWRKAFPQHDGDRLNPFLQPSGHPFARASSTKSAHGGADMHIPDPSGNRNSRRLRWDARFCRRCRRSAGRDAQRTFHVHKLRHRFLCATPPRRQAPRAGRCREGLGEVRIGLSRGLRVDDRVAAGGLSPGRHWGGGRREGLPRLRAHRFSAPSAPTVNQGAAAGLIGLLAQEDQGSFFTALGHRAEAKWLGSLVALASDRRFRWLESRPRRFCTHI